MNEKGILNNVIQVFLGIAISVLCLFIIGFIFEYIGSILSIMLIIILLSAAVIISIKLIKGKRYKALGITFLVVLIPPMSIVLLSGACFSVLGM